MPIGTKTDFKIYDEQFFTGVTEVVLQNTNVFNTASANGIQLVPARLKGDFERNSFMKYIPDLIQRRDITSTAPVPDQAMVQGEIVGVKLNRRIGPIANTLDSFKKIAEDPQVFSYLLGQQWAPELLADQVNTSILAAVTAFMTETDLVSNHNTNTITPSFLVDAVSRFGDQSRNVVAFVMHSKVWFDLVKALIAGAVTNVADVAIHTGNAATLGRPTIVTDSPALVDNSGLDPVYRTLALVAGGIVVAESEERDIASEQKLGSENLVMRIQGEYAYNLKLKGFKYSSLSANPTDSALQTPTNWGMEVHDIKACGGSVLLTL